MTIPDMSYNKNTTRIDYKGSIADPNVYAKIPSGSVTAYINMFCSQNIPNIQQGLQQIHRTLKPGGYYIVSKLNQPQPVNDGSIQFFKSKGYDIHGPSNARVTSQQSDQHIDATQWFVLQKPQNAGRKRRTIRSKRKSKKTHRKRIY